MYDNTTSFTSQYASNSQENVDLLAKYNLGLEKEFLSSESMFVAKMNEYLGHQIYEGSGLVCHKALDGLFYVLKLSSVGSEEEAITAGFKIGPPLMVKDTSITKPQPGKEEEKGKWTMHLSSKTIKITINGQEVIVAVDEESAYQQDTINMVMVYKEDGKCRVESSTLTSLKAA